MLRTASLAGKGRLLQVETKDGNNVPAEGVEYSYTLTTSSLVGDKTTSTSGSAEIDGGTNVDYVGFGTPNDLLSYQAVVEIDGEVVRTEVMFG